MSHSILYRTISEADIRLMYCQPGRGLFSPVYRAFQGFSGALTAYYDSIPPPGPGAVGGPYRAVGGPGESGSGAGSSCRISCILTYFAGFPAFCGFPPPAAPPGPYDTIYSVLMIYHTTTYSSSTIYSGHMIYSSTIYSIIYILL